MSKLLHLPNKYHIVWLDQHIGDPKYCVQLKRAFFTHADPDSPGEILPSEKDIGQFIQSDSEIPVNFNSFHFTLRAFVDETFCLRYIDEIQNDRILLIASSLLGQPAVEILLRRYPHSFINKNTDQPYNSIYIFCSDMGKAAEWAFSYYEYVQIFNFESDLLARMTRDLGEEFFSHGQELMEAARYELAFERLSWAKSLFMRYDHLMFSSQSKTETNTSAPSIGHARPSQKSLQIDQLLNLAEERKQQQHSENDSDQEDITTQIISTGIAPPVPSHHIICLHGLSSSSKEITTEDQYKMDVCSSIEVQTDDSSAQSDAQLENEIRACSLEIPGDLEILHDLDHCRQSIIENASTNAIFLVISGSVAEEMFAHIQQFYDSVKTIYILSDDNSQIVNYPRNPNIHILLFDRYNDLLMRLLRDISKYYQSKGKDYQNSTSSSAKSALIYFDWAKEMITCANQLAQNDFKDQLNSIDRCQSQTEMMICQRNSVHAVEQQIQEFQQNEDSESVAVIFIVGMEVRLIHLASGIAQLVTCTTNDQITSAIDKVKLSSPIIVVSSTQPPDNLLALDQLLNYYCFLKPGSSHQTMKKSSSYLTYVSSTDQLINQLYHKLGQYYRNRAMQVSKESKDRAKAKRLLSRSTKCYELLKKDTEKTLKHYAEILNKK